MNSRMRVVHTGTIGRRRERRWPRRWRGRWADKGERDVEGRARGGRRRGAGKWGRGMRMRARKSELCDVVPFIVRVGGEREGGGQAGRSRHRSKSRLFRILILMFCFMTMISCRMRDAGRGRLHEEL